MAEKRLDVHSFIFELGLYIAQIQGEAHARRMRVAAFWSFISLLFVHGVFEVTSPDKSVGVLGLSFRDLTEEKVLWFLFAITLYYAARFFYSAAKIFLVSRPITLWRNIRFHKKERRNYRGFPASREYMEDISSYYRDAADDTQAYFRLTQLIGAEKTAEVLNHNVHYSFVGLLENFIFPMLVFPGMCIFALFSLVKAIWF